MRRWAQRSLHGAKRALRPPKERDISESISLPLARTAGTSRAHTKKRAFMKRLSGYLLL